MKKTLITSLLVLGGMASFGTFAYQGTPGVQNPNPVDLERHEAMQKAFDKKDYSSWATLMEAKGVLNRVTTKDQFEKFVAMRNAYTKGDMTTYTTLKTELGLGQKNGSGSKQGKGQGKRISR